MNTLKLDTMIKSLQAAAGAAASITGLSETGRAIALTRIEMHISQMRRIAEHLKQPQQASERFSE